MSRSARDRAERCFALARSTTFEGERANAIAQGTRIAEAAGLSLDDFDIPGRVRRRQPGEGVRFGTPPGFVSNAAFEAAMTAAMDAIRRQAEAFSRTPPRQSTRYCPHGSDMALFGESCVLCERERRAEAPSGGRTRFCPGGCGKVILFGDGCVECDRAGRL